MTPAPADPLYDHARGCLLGLAIGDGLGQPTEGKTLAQIRERWGFITDFVSDDPGGSDDTEYAVLCAHTLLRHGRGMTSAHVAEAWRTHIVSQKGGFKGAGFSEMLAIQLLREGQDPPHSGEHLHSWSDGLAMRVAPFGIVAAGDPSEAARLAQIDGMVSHAGEGLFSGQAVAAAIACAMPGGGVAACTEAALAVIPEDSWTARAIREGVGIGKQASSVEASLEPLYKALVCAYYPWADLGPEAVGLAFGLLHASREDFEQAVLGGTNIGRDTDTIAAIAGAILGAQLGYARLPQRWATRIQTIKGRCIHAVAGVDLLALADDLATLALSPA